MKWKKQKQITEARWLFFLYKCQLVENTDSVVTIHIFQMNLSSIALKKLWETKFHLNNNNNCNAFKSHSKDHYLYIKVRRYVRVADLVLQLESSAEDRIMLTAFWRWGSQKILHLSNSKAALANVDKSLFDVSFKRKIRVLGLKMRSEILILL